MQTRNATGEGTLPHVVQAKPHRHAGPAAAASWATAHRRDLDEQLLRTGALLLRGLPIDTAEAFRGVVASIHPRLRDYAGGDSPREAVGDGIYTSTEFPSHVEIGLHNELSYTKSWPERVFFCCLVPAGSGGETHIADGRGVFAQMDPKVRERFSKRGVIYRQHLRHADEDGPGRSWQETFETTDRDEAERICHNQGLESRWTPRGFQTSLRNPGVLNHPATGESCWFNQADLWHRSFDTVKAQEHRTLSNEHADDPIGSHACYGDGSEIPIADLEAVRWSYKKCESLFQWHAGDVLMLDNVLTMHGRKPFGGERRVLVAMT